jgi:hypothetical protein
MLVHGPHEVNGMGVFVQTFVIIGIDLIKSLVKFSFWISERVLKNKEPAEKQSDLRLDPSV